MEPVEILLELGQLFIAIGIAVPTFVSFARLDWNARDAITAFWFVPLVPWVAIVAGVLITEFVADLTEPVGLIACAVAVLTLILIPHYISLGRFLVNDLTTRLLKEEEVDLGRLRIVSQWPVTDETSVIHERDVDPLS